MKNRTITNRRNSIWGIPFLILIFIANVLICINDTFPNISDLHNNEAIVKIVPIAPLLISSLPTPAILLLTMIANAIPCKERVLKIMERILIVMLSINFASIAISFIILIPLQYYAMPKLGYTNCSILRDHPTIYFTDWVKNPEWCVRGKTREWVKEQARLSGNLENP